MKTFLKILTMLIAFLTAGRAHAGFEPVRSEDWPQSGETRAPAQQQAPDADDGDDEAPAANSAPGPAMPELKRRPDGSIDPDAFKQFM